jgi:hypothetical protein
MVSGTESAFAIYGCLVHTVELLFGLVYVPGVPLLEFDA